MKSPFSKRVIRALELLCEAYEKRSGIGTRYSNYSLINELQSHGLLFSVRGRGGGVFLGREPEEITLYDVMVAVEGALEKDETPAGLLNMFLARQLKHAKLADFVSQTIEV
jgi:DNA-binding IscR family transcriptional regulator